MRLHHTAVRQMRIITMNKCYSELITLDSFEDRLLYLQTHGKVGLDTFGPYRYLIERFLQSQEWKNFRRSIILRDNACDLAHPDHQVRLSKGQTLLLIHHIMPSTIDDIKNQRWDRLMNPENVITTTFKTHQQIHYGYKTVVHELYKERKPNDTCPWR